VITFLFLSGAAFGAQPTQPTAPSTQGSPNASGATDSQTSTRKGAPAAGGQRADFALFDGTDASGQEVGAQCGATLGSSKNSAGFTYYVTVSNWSDELKILDVRYADGQEVARYQIPAHTSFAFSHAAGGTPGSDDLISVFGEGSAPTGLAGAMSIQVPAGAKPHTSQGDDFCATLTAAPTTTAPATR
jgi:hypothetical protein